jgi:Fe-S-cluster containining protein
MSRTTVRVEFAVAGERIEAQVAVPTEPTATRDLLPFFRAVAEVVVGRAVRQVGDAGDTVSCRAGCGACCRQLVPITPPEAHQIAAVIEAMPEARREVVERRFAEARAKLSAASLLDTLLRPEDAAEGSLRRLGLDYFELEIACPFLEDESCSIYEERPIACREYLVTSPAEACARPSAETVRCVPLPAKASNAVSRIDEDPDKRFIPWVPLILAPEWSRSNPEGPPTLMGPELLRRFFSRLAEPAQPP